MNHGIATLRRDWDIFKHGDRFQITAWLPFDEIFGIIPLDKPGPWMALHENESDFRNKFDVELF